MEFANIWEYILKTNTFNFILFVIIIAIICRMVNLPKILEGLRQSIEKTVTESVDAKENAKKALEDAKQKMDNIQNDIDDIEKNSDKVTQKLSENIISQAQKRIAEIENNTQKVFENDMKITKANLSKLATKASLELTQNNLKEQLKEDKNLHQIFIDEAIDAIGTLEI